jgi:hypothetical protein
MITALALCLHLNAVPTKTPGGHLLTGCKATSAAVATFQGPDGSPGYLAVMPPEKWDEAKAKTTGGDGGPVYTSEVTHMVLMLHAPSEWLKNWVDLLGADCQATADIPVVTADIAREKANPAGVVNLVRLHDLGERLQADRDVVAAYRTSTGQALPAGVCPVP